MSGTTIHVQFRNGDFFTIGPFTDEASRDGALGLLEHWEARPNDRVTVQTVAGTVNVNLGDVTSMKFEH